MNMNSLVVNAHVIIIKNTLRKAGKKKFLFYVYCIIFLYMETW